jgi:hypothetical protein
MTLIGAKIDSFDWIFFSSQNFDTTIKNRLFAMVKRGIFGIFIRNELN